MGGDTVLARHHARLIVTLVRCMRLSFTGGAPVADADMRYAEVTGTGAAVGTCNTYYFLFGWISIVLLCLERVF